MNKVLIGFVFLVMMFVFVNIVLAEEDTVSFNTTDNMTNTSYTININVQITGNDSQLRSDVYGTNSSVRDKLLDGASADDETQLREICSQSDLQAYFNGIGTIPPAEFVNYLKSLGYGDETHISFIWNMCQQEYISQHQDQWSQVGGGMQPGDLFSVLKDALGWLLGSGKTIYPQSKDVATLLEGYFASDRDVATLNNKVNQLDLRLQVLERTMENVSAEAYCQGKIDIMKQYNLTGVKCGVNSTIYWNAKKAGFDGYDIISYRDCNEDWSCSAWSQCSDGAQTRKCVDKNDCGTFSDKPAETQACGTKQIAAQQSVSPTNNAPKVETSVSIDQLLERYMPMLMIALLSIPGSLIIFGIKRDISSKRRR